MTVAPGKMRFPYWRIRRGFAIAGHMVALLPRAAWNAIRLINLRRTSGIRRPSVAIALVDAMGDIVAAEPIGRLARQRYPTAWICWVTRAEYSSLPSAYSGVDQVIAVSCLTEWMLLRRLAHFDLVWDLHHDGRACGLCGIPQIKPGVLTNASNYFKRGNLLDMECDSAGISRLTEGPRLVPPAAAVLAVDALALPSDFIVVHCVSRERRKDWPADKWRDLAHSIIHSHEISILEVGVQPLLVGEETERQRSLCGKLSLLETAEVIRRATLFIGIDSGPAHLANAVSTPGVILLGAYANFGAYMPYSGGYASGATADIVRANGPIADLPVAVVLDAVMGRLPARAARESLMRPLSTATPMLRTRDPAFCRAPRRGQQL